MEGIQGLRRQTPISTQRTAPAAAKKTAAPARTDTFQSVLTKEERAEQAARTPDLPNFSKMTDRQKLSALATLHDATDWGGMTDVEKYKLMNDRFEAAFPHRGSYMGGLYGPAGIYFENPVDQANHRKTLPERICDEWSRECSTAGLTKVYKLHKEAYYSGMTDEEMVAAIFKRHQGGTIADRFDALYEWSNIRDATKHSLEAIDYAIGDAMFAMRKTVCRVATGSEHFPVLGFYSPGQFRAVQSAASGMKVSWAELKQMTLESAGAFSDSLALEFGKSVQEAIDELFHTILDAGAQ